MSVEPKYLDRFGNGFERWPVYGVPDHWIAPIDEALDRVFELAPQAVICQIKVKFGGLRIYLGGVPDDVADQVQEIIENVEDHTSHLGLGAGLG